jgi:hypothetical protein
MWPTQLPIQYEKRIIFPGVKQSVFKANQSQLLPRLRSSGGIKPLFQISLSRVPLQICIHFTKEQRTKREVAEMRFLRMDKGP